MFLAVQALYRQLSLHRGDVDEVLDWILPPVQCAGRVFIIGLVTACWHVRSL